MRRVPLIASLLLAVPVAAQFPIGSATPVGAFGPSLFSEPIWIGNPGFGYRIRGAPPGGAAFVAVSAARQDLLLGGLQIYVDVESVLITHTATIDANGKAFIPLPLGSADDPSLTGLRFWGQAAVSDPGTNALGTTQGLLIEITAHPLLAYSRWLGQLALIDPVAGTTKWVTGLAPTAQASDAEFGGGGRDLWVATDAGLYVVDTYAFAPQAVLVAPGSFTSLAWDRVHARVYVLKPQSQLLAVYDGNHASPGFGTLIAQTTDASRSLAISAEGRLLALADSVGTVGRRDADPASPAYLQPIPTPQAPGLLGVAGSVDRVHLSPDGRVLSLAALYFLQPHWALHRFDGLTGAWIDHDPATPGYQPVTTATYPQLPGMFGFVPSRDGSMALFTGQSTVARIDFDLSNPAALAPAATPIVSPGIGNTFPTLTPSGRFVLQRFIDFNVLNSPLELSLVELANGWGTPLATLPLQPNPITVDVAVWR